MKTGDYIRYMNISDEYVYGQITRVYGVGMKLANLRMFGHDTNVAWPIHLLEKVPSAEAMLKMLENA